MPVISDNVGSIMPHNRIKTYHIDSVSYLIFIHSAFHWFAKTKYFVTLTTKLGLPQDVSGREGLKPLTVFRWDPVLFPICTDYLAKNVQVLTVLLSCVCHDI